MGRLHDGIVISLAVSAAALTSACGSKDKGSTGGSVVGMGGMGGMGDMGGMGGERSDSNSAPSPAANSIETFKNTPGSTTLDPMDPDMGDSHEFAITGEPANGSATVSADGVVTYEPDTDYVGEDSLTVEVTDDSGATAAVEVSVTVENRAPKGTAELLTLDIDGRGTTTIEVEDADPGENFTFAIATAPTYGTATVDDEGVVSYLGGPGVFEDLLVVEVTDSSGATVEVTVEVARELVAFEGTNGAWPDSLCTDGQQRVSLVEISPAIGTRLDPDTEYTFTARLWYQDAGAVGIKVARANDAGTTATVDPDEDCGVVDVEMTFKTPDVSEGRVTLSLVGASDFKATYLVTAESATVDSSVITSIFPPLGTVITDPFYEVYFRSSFQGTDYGAFTRSFYYVYDTSGDAVTEDYVFPMQDETDRPHRVRGRLSCGDVETGFYTQFNDDGRETLTQYVLYPAVPPVVQVDAYPSEFAVTGVDSPFPIEVAGCDGDTDVTMTASDDWISVPATFTALQASDTFNVTIHGADLEIGQRYTGSITVTPDGADPIHVPVNVVRIAQDLSDTGPYTAQALAGKDDGYATVDLPFTFPAEGLAIDQVVINTNGALLLQVSDGTACRFTTDYEVSYGLDHRSGCPLVAVGMKDHGFEYPDDEMAIIPDVYTRIGSEGDGEFMEFVFYNMQAYRSDYYGSFSTRVVRLWDDGRIEIELPVWNPTGMEWVGWAHSDSSDGVRENPFLITNGMTFEYGPIPELTP